MPHLPKPPRPRGPAGFPAFDFILQRALPFTASDGRPFARVSAPQGSGRRSLPIHSHAFRNWFFTHCYSEFETIPTAHAFSAIRRHLQAQAAADPNVHVSRRVSPGPTPDSILLDLADPEGQSVEISPGRWNVSSALDFAFETSRSTVDLPAPEPPSESSPDPLDFLRASLNLGPAHSPTWLRALAWLLSAFRPSGPFPILVLRGPSGSGKSLAARTLRAFIDPSTAPLQSLPASVPQLHSLARHNYILAFDHVSRLSPELSDALCRLSSGIAVATPDRSSDRAEPFQAHTRRPILLTVTEDFALPPALAARALTVTLPALTAETRRPEEAVLQPLREVFPQILGALCTAVSTALGRIHIPIEPHPTRHTGALAWAIAAAPALGITEQHLRAAFDAPSSAHPIVDTVTAFTREHSHWTGTASDLAQALHYPRSPKLLSEQLRLHALDLAEAGIDVEFRRLHGGTRIIELRASPAASPDPAPPPQPPDPEPLTPTPEIPPASAPCVTPNPHPHSPPQAKVGQAILPAAGFSRRHRKRCAQRHLPLICDSLKVGQAILPAAGFSRRGRLSCWSHRLFNPAPPGPREAPPGSREAPGPRPPRSAPGPRPQAVFQDTAI